MVLLVLCCFDGCREPQGDELPSILPAVAKTVCCHWAFSLSTASPHGWGNVDCPQNPLAAVDHVIVVEVG